MREAAGLVLESRYPVRDRIFDVIGIALAQEDDWVAKAVFDEFFHVHFRKMANRHPAADVILGASGATRRP